MATRLVRMLFDDKHRLSFRAFILLSLIISLLVIDNYIGFSDYYNYEKKVAQIIQIETAIGNPRIDSATKVRLKRLETEIVERRSWLAYLPSLYSFAISKTSSRINQKTNPKSGKIIVEEVKINPLYQLLSAGLPFTLVIVLAFLTAFFVDKIRLNTIIGFIAVMFIIQVPIALLAFVYSLIPIIDNRPYINYMINFVLSTALFLFIMYQQGAKKSLENP